MYLKLQEASLMSFTKKHHHRCFSGSYIHLWLLKRSLNYQKKPLCHQQWNTNLSLVFSEDYETWKSKKKYEKIFHAEKQEVFLVALNFYLLSDLLNEIVWQIIKLLTTAHPRFPPRTSLENFLLLLGDSCGWFSQNIALVYKKLVRCILR